MRWVSPGVQWLIATGWLSDITGGWNAAGVLMLMLVPQMISSVWAVGGDRAATSMYQAGNDAVRMQCYTSRPALAPSDETVHDH